MTDEKWIPFIFDENGKLIGEIPDDRILVSDGQSVWMDCLSIDDEGEEIAYYLDFADDLDDFNNLAWMPLPKPYVKGVIKK